MSDTATISKPKGRLNGLEALRGLAAAYIVVHHYGASANWPIRKFLAFGPLAVMVFFILSGFVIYLSSGIEKGAFNVGDYAKKRALRILPPYWAALLLAYLVSSYNNSSWDSFKAGPLVRNMFFLVETHTVHGAFPYKHNSPIWSLSYEAWFYVFFAIIALITKGNFVAMRKYAVGLSAIGIVTVWVLPNPVSLYAVLFIVWWMGVELAHEYATTGSVSFRGQRDAYLMLGGIAVLWFARMLGWRLQGHRMWDAYPLMPLKQMAYAAAIVAIALYWFTKSMRGFHSLVGPFRYLSKVSYGLYIFHFPLVLLAADQQFTRNSYIDLVWFVPSLLIIAYVFDYQLHRLCLWATRRR